MIPKGLEQIAIALQNLPEEFVYCPVRGRWLSAKEFRQDIESARTPFKGAQKELAILAIENSYEFLVLFFALLLERQTIMLSGMKTLSELSYLISEYRPKYVFHKSVSPDNEQDVGNLFIGDVLMKEFPLSEISIKDSLCDVLLGTSGSTGSPKFVQLRIDNLVANAKSISKALDIQPSDRAITCLPTSYSFGLSILTSYIFSSASLVIWSKGILDPEFWNLMKREKVTSLSGVPYTYQMLKRMGLSKMDLPDLKVLTQAGGRLAENLVKEFHEISLAKDMRFYVMYGQTEATARITCLPFDKLTEKSGSVGKAIPGGQIKIIHFENENEGEVVYEGPNVMLGYAESRTDLLSGDVAKGVLHTGDIGYLDPDGFLYITGRLKRIAKVAGIRISLDEVEKMAGDVGPVAAASSDEKIVLFHHNPDDTIIANCIDNLSKIMKLHRSLFKAQRIDNFPINNNGKIDYIALGKML